MRIPFVINNYSIKGVSLDVLQGFLQHVFFEYRPAETGRGLRGGRLQPPP